MPSHPRVQGAATQAVLHRHEWLAHAGIVAALGVLAWLAGSGGWDERIEAHFFSAAGHSFPLRDAFLFKSLLHDDAKELPALVAAALLFVGVHGHVADASRWRAWRLEAVYALAVLVVSTAIAGLLKNSAPMQCPWSLAEYGGHLPHYTLSGWLAGHVPAAVQAGHCWPSGHAAGAFGMIGLYFAARSRGHARAVPLFMAIVLWGALCSYTQLARGAHFLSHVLWSAAICWAVAMALLPLLGAASRTPVPIAETAVDGGGETDAAPSVAGERGLRR